MSTHTYTQTRTRIHGVHVCVYMYMCVCARIYVCMHKLKCVYIYASILYLCIYAYTKGIKLLLKVIRAIIIQNNNGRYLSFPLYYSSQDLTRKLWICKTSY